MNMKSHGNELPKGYQLLWYRISGVLGQGGFGITYEAFDTNLQTNVAIKEYLPREFAVREQDSTVRPFTEDRKKMFEWGMERFLQEARTLARFHHQNIIRVYNVFEKNGTAYMVMDYEQGESLDQLFKMGRLGSEKDLMRILMPLLDGIGHMHDAGFIHRDIKPPNIYIRLDGSPVLLDFGSARFAIGGETRTLTSLVTPGFAPFEQYNPEGTKQGPWTDIYGLGATLYAGINRGHGPIEAIIRGTARIEGKPDPLEPAVEKGKAHYSDAFLRAIDAALGFHAEERPQTVDEWKKLFAPVEDQATSPPKRTRREENTPTFIRSDEVEARTTKGRRLVVWATAVLIAVGLVVTGTYYMNMWNTSDAPGFVRQYMPGLDADKTALEKQKHEEVLRRQQEAEQARLAREAAARKQEEERIRKLEQERIAAQIAEEKAQLEQERVRIQAEEAARKKEEQISGLISKAEKALAANRLTSPVGNNAMEYFEAVMGIDHDNAVAKQGIGRVVKRYIELAENSANKKQWDKAARYLEKANMIDPDSNAVSLANERLSVKRVQVEAEERRLAEIKRQKIIEEQHKRQANEEARKKEQVKLEKYRVLLNESEMALNKSQFIVARDKLKEAELLYPEKTADQDTIRMKINNCLAIVGEWRWNNGGKTSINADGTCKFSGIIIGLFANTGTWECADPANKHFILNWKQGNFVDRLNLSEDEKKLEGIGGLGLRVTAKRIE